MTDPFRRRKLDGEMDRQFGKPALFLEQQRHRLLSPR
jgi:hypothetical protein